MANAVRSHETGGPEVLRYEDAELGEPGAGAQDLPLIFCASLLRKTKVVRYDQVWAERA